MGRYFGRRAFCVAILRDSIIATHLDATPLENDFIFHVSHMQYTFQMQNY